MGAMGAALRASSKLTLRGDKYHHTNAIANVPGSRGLQARQQRLHESRGLEGNQKA
jgi:hypothetical protein